MDGGLVSPAPIIRPWGNIGITENQMETTIEYWDYIGIMDKKMETTKDPILSKSQVEDSWFAV